MNTTFNYDILSIDDLARFTGGGIVYSVSHFFGDFARGFWDSL